MGDNMDLGTGCILRNYRSIGVGAVPQVDFLVAHDPGVIITAAYCCGRGCRSGCGDLFLAQQAVDNIAFSEASCINIVIFGTMGQHFDLGTSGQGGDGTEAAVRSSAQGSIIGINPGRVG